MFYLAKIDEESCLLIYILVLIFVIFGHKMIIDMDQQINTLHIEQFNELTHNQNFYVSTLTDHLINHHHRIE